MNTKYCISKRSNNHAIRIQFQYQLVNHTECVKFIEIQIQTQTQSFYIGFTGKRSESAIKNETWSNVMNLTMKQSYKMHSNNCWKIVGGRKNARLSMLID